MTIDPEHIESARSLRQILRERFTASAALPLAIQAVEATQLAARYLPDGATLQIDGRVTDEAWLAVEPYTTFTQTDPIEGAPASERTEVRVLFDKANLYIGVICFDSEPGKIVVSQSRRDADLTETDAIIMVLDTFNDTLAATPRQRSQRRARACSARPAHLRPAAAP